MNIFVSNTDPIKCAINLDDKRVKHMPKESLEMITMAIYKRTNNIVGDFIIWGKNYRNFNDLFYHPCTEWTARKETNLYWHWQHLIALLDEYRYRFNKQHWLEDQVYNINHWIRKDCNSPKNFRDSSGQFGSNIIDNYKKCLNFKWIYTDEIKPIIWTRRNSPVWYKGNEILLNFNPIIDKDEYTDDLPF